MRDVFIVGLGLTPVKEHWNLSLRQLGAQAIRAALDDAKLQEADSLLVGNMLSGAISGQENLGTLLADEAGLLPIEAVKVEAACGSGGAAVRHAAQAVASGASEVAIAVGLEKMTDAPADFVTAGLARASDQEFEASFGLSFVGMAALLTQRYLHETGRSHADFAPLVINAHANAVTAAHAMFHSVISAEQFARSPIVASPLRVLDAAPICDGAAAVVVCSKEALKPHHLPVRIAASSVATDTISLAARRSLLRLEAAAVSAERAYRLAKMSPADIQLFEPHDAFTIMTALSLEACGFAGPKGALRASRAQTTAVAGAPDIARLGAVLDRVREGMYALDGELPICTFGGLKGRGHPVGASGTYQVVEACMQLRGEAGKNQVQGVKRAMTQSIGGHGAVAVTHILEA
jgi:acetyl-CoA C-acetyltransferase